MSLTINTLISRMKKRLPGPVFQSVDNDFWIEILLEESLSLFSSYYPTVVKGILVTQDMAIETIDMKRRRNKSSRYAIPMVDELYPYTGISTFHYPRNYLGGGVFSHNGVVDAVTSKIISSTNPVDVKYTATFEAPNVIVITPPPYTHLDFNLSLYRLKRLEEIDTGYHELFKKLYEADCKIALYHKFYTVSEGGTFAGIDLKDYVAGFNDFEDKRNEYIEEMEKDYYKDPIRFEEIFNYNVSYV